MDARHSVGQIEARKPVRVEDVGVCPATAVHQPRREPGLLKRTEAKLDDRFGLVEPVATIERRHPAAA